jgi:hypothetical protein
VPLWCCTGLSPPPAASLPVKRAYTILLERRLINIYPECLLDLTKVFPQPPTIERPEELRYPSAVAFRAADFLSSTFSAARPEAASRSWNGGTERMGGVSANAPLWSCILPGSQILGPPSNSSGILLWEPTRWRPVVVRYKPPSHASHAPYKTGIASSAGSGMWRHGKTPWGLAVTPLPARRAGATSSLQPPL